MLQYFCWLYCELHVELLQSFMLSTNIRNAEIYRGNILIKNCFLVCFCCRIIVQFMYKLGTVFIVRRGNGEPTVFSRGDVAFLHKAKSFSIKFQGFILIVNE